MNDDLRRLVHDRLSADGLLQKNSSSLVLAACDGRDAVESLLLNETATAKPRAPAGLKKHAGAYLTSLAVQGFRGIGPKQTLSFTPGPGLTIVIGRNGSGKSSFAEALEVLFTGDSRRWSERSKVWKEGWRNLHQPHPASIEAELLLEGQGSAKVACDWDDAAALEAQKVVVQPKGKPKTSLEALGWKAALVSYRPFLSYNELGSMLDDGPSKLYDALSLVLGLEDLVGAQTSLAKSRLDRQQAWDAADQERIALVERLKGLLEKDADDRGSVCLDALTSKPWGLDSIDAVLASGAVPQAVQDISILTRAVSLDPGDPERVASAIAALRESDRQLKAVAGSDADSSRQVVLLLEAALTFHAVHGDGDCPVCRKKAGLTSAWAASGRKEVERLRMIAADSDHAHRAADGAMRTARELLTAPPPLLAQLFEIGVVEHLRQQSNVALGRIELAGTKSQRRVTLDVTVDGIPGAALGVMSQGELHALALSLFLPRATLSESPFRFVVIDDPVQSMDPARVDGLARALEDTARTRQVIVFTHDERLAEAVRRLNVKSTILSITRRPKSVVEVRTSLDPIRAHIEDALALVHTTELPKDVLRSLVPGFCRSALEASFISLVRRRRLSAGRPHSEVEEALKDAGKLTGLAALALFDDKDRGGDVLKRLNQFGTWAGDVFKQSKDGVHQAVAGDLQLMIWDTEKLVGKIVELK